MNDSRVLLVTRIALGIFWFCVILFVLVGSVGDSPLRYSRAAKLNLLTVAPQGWSFFTRDPREARDYVYRKVGQEWEYAGLTNSDLSNFFGIRRRARMSAMELAALLSQVPDDQWVMASGGVDELRNSFTLPVVAVENRIVSPTLCGELLVQRRPPVPWAWSRSHDRILMPSQVVKLQASCP